MNNVVKAWGLMFGLAAAAVPGCAQDYSWKVVDGMIASDFPEVHHISTDSLANWIGDRSRPQPILLDTRKRAEYAVSHLAGAIRIDPDATAFPQLDTVDRDAPIVAYCSVGYRSAQIAQRLAKLGFTNVLNLRGSIFRWANEGRPVYDEAGNEVEKVHPYDRVWGTLLDKKLRSYGTK